ncbi:hypothetical protein KVR01_003356 [Diaporthe batatas]|uniref:uncharacterized protein n=1 Tax=Diaporthe batatas TaxID=748121 RepID=UPI001D03B4DB|nr:uncharacterized protein KVR01_003356 [Diaporthe batatas]KAG8167667.1 hypothetical protein KVR01_003356 [Diaporthe batatas]
MAQKLERAHLGPEPKRKYVEEIQNILMQIQVRSATNHFPLQKPLPMPAPNRLPLEIVESIIAMVEYQPCVVTRRSEERTYRALHWRGSRTFAALYLTTEPLPRKFDVASRMTLQMRAAEQNWARMMTGDGTSDDSRSWFEVCILRRLPYSSSFHLGPLEQFLTWTYRTPLYAWEDLSSLGWRMVPYEGNFTFRVPRSRTKVSGWDTYQADWKAGPKPCEECEHDDDALVVGILKRIKQQYNKHPAAVKSPDPNPAVKSFFRRPSFQIHTQEASAARKYLRKMGNTFSSTRSGNNSRPSRRETETPQLEPAHKGFNPTRQDIQIATHILMGLRLQAAPGHLPSELALSILAHADYRPRVTSSQVGPMSYTSGGGRPWYLMAPGLPRDFARATSVTLQVRGCEVRRIGPAEPYYHYPGDSDDDLTDEGDRRRRGSTWFKLLILRAVRRAPTNPPVNGYVVHGCVARRVPEPGSQRTPSPRRRCDSEDSGDWQGDPDFRVGDEWMAVRHHDRVVWVIPNHSSRRVSDDLPSELSGEQFDEGPTAEVVRPRCRETYRRVDWPPDNNPEIQDPEAFVDGGGFLSSLMPGDKIVLSAGVEPTEEEPVAMFTIKEAILEIVYDAMV